MTEKVLVNPKSEFSVFVLVPFILYLLIYFALIFKGVYVRGDDFAYVESVVQSLASGRLITHDWLGPFNVFFTLTGVVAYSLTHHFYFSTYGILSIFSMTNFWLLIVWTHKRFNLIRSSWLALAIVTFPFYLHKSLDYHGCIPTLTCFLVALLCYENKRYGLMFIAIFLAVSTRQNSLFLFLLPTYSLCEMILLKKKMEWRIGIYMMVCFGALVLLRFQLGENWFHHGYHPLGRIMQHPLGIVRQFFVGIFLGIFFLSINSFFIGDRKALSLFRENLQHYFLPLVFTFIFSLIAFFSPAALVWFQTPLIGSLDHTGQLQWGLKILVLISFWFIDRQLLKLSPYLILGIGYVGISCLLGFFWDYYLSELALIAVWICLRVEPIDTEDKKPSRIFPIVLSVLFIVNFGYGYLYKVQLDKLILSNLVFEKLERHGRIAPQNMTGATFGFLGFKLCGLLAEENPNYEHDDFSCYVQANGVNIQSALPWKRHLPRLDRDQVTVLDSGFASIGFLNLPYRVVDFKNPEGLNICHEEFKVNEKTKSHSRPFPLNNNEWDAFIKKSREDFNMRKN